MSQQMMQPMRMVTNPASIGHAGNLQQQSKEEILSAGFPDDVIQLLDILMQGGSFRIVTRNFEGLFQAFSQLKLHPLTVEDLVPLSAIGTLSPPKPHLGFMQRNARGNSPMIWRRG